MQRLLLRPLRAAAAGGPQVPDGEVLAAARAHPRRRHRRRRMICTRRRWRRSTTSGSSTMPAYVDAVANGTVAREIQRRIGFPWSPQMVERSRRSVGATIAAAHAALDEGVAANLAGGTHHAFADRGEGFCVFNDVAVAARVLQRDQLARPHRRSSISTCTRATAPPRSSAATRRSSPSRCTATRTFRSRKKSSDLDVPLADGTGDDEYLSLLQRTCPTS